MVGGDSVLVEVKIEVLIEFAASSKSFLKFKFSFGKKL